MHAGRTAPIGHQTLELIRSDWLNLEPLPLDNPRPVCFISKRTANFKYLIGCRGNKHEHENTNATNHTHHHHFLFTAASQSNTRQSFATKSAVNKRVNACIETLRHQNIKNATQYCAQTVDRGLCSVRSLGDHAEQCSFITFANSTCCDCSPHGSK